MSKEYIEREKVIEVIKNYGKNAIDIGQSSLDPVDDIILLQGAVGMIPAADVIVPPCKVGDIVYWINHVTKEIETDIVIAIHQYENGLSIATSTIGTKGTTTFGLNRFLEIMHFTKEEAEQALAERREE